MIIKFMLKFKGLLEKPNKEQGVKKSSNLDYESAGRPFESGWARQKFSWLLGCPYHKKEPFLSSMSSKRDHDPPRG